MMKDIKTISNITCDNCNKKMEYNTIEIILIIVGIIFILTFLVELMISVKYANTNPLNIYNLITGSLLLIIGFKEKVKKFLKKLIREKKNEKQF